METNDQNTAANAKNEDSRVRKELIFGPIEVSRIYTGNYQKEGTVTAELKQIVTNASYYPSKSVTSNLHDNPFSNEDFGFKEKDYKNDEKRVTWIDVPAGSTVESVKAKLATFPEARLYKIMANKPILTQNQKYAIDEGLTTMDIIGDRQVIRYPDGDANAGQLIPDPNGKPQYRSVFFKTTKVDDIDLRTDKKDDYYATEAVKRSLSMVTGSVSADQDAL